MCHWCRRPEAEKKKPVGESKRTKKKVANLRDLARNENSKKKTSDFDSTQQRPQVLGSACTRMCISFFLRKCVETLSAALEKLDLRKKKEVGRRETANGSRMKMGRSDVGARKSGTIEKTFQIVRM